MSKVLASALSLWGAAILVGVSWMAVEWAIATVTGDERWWRFVIRAVIG